MDKSIYKIASEKIIEFSRNTFGGFTKAMQLMVVRLGGTHPVRSVQVVLDYPKPGPRVSRFTGIAKMRRAAKQRKAAK